jgi:hypothetical protein
VSLVLEKTSVTGYTLRYTLTSNISAHYTSISSEPTQFYNTASWSLLNSGNLVKLDGDVLVELTCSVTVQDGVTGEAGVEFNISNNGATRAIGNDCYEFNGDGKVAYGRRYFWLKDGYKYQFNMTGTGTQGKWRTVLVTITTNELQDFLGKTMINGTSYSITQGITVINGIAYTINKGKFKTGGTVYSTGAVAGNQLQKTVPVTISGIGNYAAVYRLEQHLSSTSVPVGELLVLHIYSENRNGSGYIYVNNVSKLHVTGFYQYYYYYYIPYDVSSISITCTNTSSQGTIYVTETA